MENEVHGQLNNQNLLKVVSCETEWSKRDKVANQVETLLRIFEDLRSIESVLVLYTSKPSSPLLARLKIHLKNVQSAVVGYSWDEISSICEDLFSFLRVDTQAESVGPAEALEVVQEFRLDREKSKFQFKQYCRVSYKFHRNLLRGRGAGSPPDLDGLFSLCLAEVCRDTAGWDARLEAAALSALEMTEREEAVVREAWRVAGFQPELCPHIQIFTRGRNMDTGEGISPLPHTSTPLDCSGSRKLRPQFEFYSEDEDRPVRSCDEVPDHNCLNVSTETEEEGIQSSLSEIVAQLNSGSNSVCWEATSKAGRLVLQGRKPDGAV